MRQLVAHSFESEVSILAHKLCLSRRLAGHLTFGVDVHAYRSDHSGQLWISAGFLVVGEDLGEFRLPHPIEAHL
jgi:hypothetical protein